VKINMQIAAPVITIGWILAVIALILCIVFFVIGVPDPKTLLLLIGLVALARLL